MYMFVYICVRMYVCVSVCTCVRMYVCGCVWMCVCVGTKTIVMGEVVPDATGNGRNPIDPACVTSAKNEG